MRLVKTLRYRKEGTWWRWEGSPAYYRPKKDIEVKKRLHDTLMSWSQTLDDGMVVPLEPSDRQVREYLETLKMAVLVVDGVDEDDDAGNVLLPCAGGVPFRNGWLCVDERQAQREGLEVGELVPLSPERDIRWLVDVDYREGVRCTEDGPWLSFLDSIGWGAGSEERELLQEWFGYLLSGSKDQQKMLLLLGKKRSGKGTILKVAHALLGDGAVGMQLDSLSSNFGLQPMLGKALATFGDVRFTFKTDKKVVERLLSIVGDDDVIVDVKNKEPVSVRLGVRLMMASNELPHFIEASDALASRFLILKTQGTHYENPDTGLEARLMADLAGVATWALEGWERLRRNGHFTETESGREAVEEMALSAAPVRQFIEDRCEIQEPGSGVDWFTPNADLYDTYVDWCGRNGEFQLSERNFGRDLNTAFGDVVQMWKRSGVRGRLRIRIVKKR